MRTNQRSRVRYLLYFCLSSQAFGVLVEVESRESTPQFRLIDSFSRENTATGEYTHEWWIEIYQDGERQHKIHVTLTNTIDNTYTRAYVYLVEAVAASENIIACKDLPEANYEEAFHRIMRIALWKINYLVEPNPKPELPLPGPPSTLWDWILDG